MHQIMVDHDREASRKLFYLFNHTIEKDISSIFAKKLLYNIDL